MNHLKLLWLFPLFLIVTLVGCIAYAQSDSYLLKQVQEKMAKDDKELKDFLALGKLHCMDNRLNYYDDDYDANKMYKKGMFYHEHAAFFNSLSNVTRLIREDRLDTVFAKFEQINLTKPEIREDHVLVCNTLYETKGQELYQQIVKDPTNYINGDPKEYNEEHNMWTKQDVRDYFSDYLKYEHIDMRRMLDSCQTHDCK